jgi:AraC-like DNA-binding protein
MRTGDAILIAPGAGSTILVDGAHVCRGLAIPYRTLYRMTGVEASPLPSDGDFGPLHGRLLRNTTLRSLLDELCREASSSRPHGALLADGITVQIAATLLRMRDGAGEPVPSGLAPWQLRRATDLLMSRLAGDVALTDVADELGLSAAHLPRAFKQSTGLPPWRWLAERRIERAKALLADPSLSLTDVAQMVGYAGQTTFGEAFRRATGMTPGAFRREIRR